MCGIAGIMMRGRAAAPEQLLTRLGDAQAHRGPDGSGQYRRDDVGLVHNRLSIIDLVTGDQPLSEPGGATLVANGEIYNYVELRAAMAGAAFATQSDCETPLLLYRREGMAFPDRLRGMYSIALHDPKERRLVLSRDAFGIKPLYYTETPQGFMFASEPQALIAAAGPRALDPQRRAELLQLQFTTGAETIFTGIRRVLPGETITVSEGRVIGRSRRSALPEGAPEPRSEDEAMAALDHAFENSVTVHQRSDVPYGMFLSGGIDSSAILAQMARLNPRPVVAFTAWFPEAPVADERDAARRVARATGAEHIETPVTAKDFWELLPRIAAAVDDPTADYACVPTYVLGAAAREAGLKVVLSGEGGDEMFAGYGRYRRVLRPFWLGGRGLREMRRRGVFEGLGVLRDDRPEWRDGVEATRLAVQAGGRTRLQTAQAIDCADWLPNDLLTKLDRCLMAHGVEGRTPFLDPAIAAVAFNLPDRLKIRDRQGKYLLRRWLARRLPEALSTAPKRGFTTPVAAWIVAQGARLGELVAAQPGIAEIAEPAEVRRLFAAANGRRTGAAAWTMLFYALWHRRHILGRAPDGDVFACLSAR